MQHIGQCSSATAAALLDHAQSWHEARAKAIGGSDACAIVRADPAELEQLRLQKLGRAGSEDLSLVLPVQMGSWTEGLNRLWLARAIAMEVSDGVSKIHRVHDFMRANLDGTTPDGGIVECKHVNSFTKFEDALTRYYPQLQHNIAVADAPFLYLSVFFGSDKHVWQKIDRDEPYIAQLIEAERAFWTHVVMDVPVIEAKAVAGAAPVVALREVDMTGSNSWAKHAGDWLMLKDQAKDFEKAGKELKTLVEADVKRAHGHGIEICRDGRGLTIKEVKAKKEAA